MKQTYCPCGFDCSKMDASFGEKERCANRYQCRAWAEAWDLPYEYDLDGCVLTVLPFESNVDLRQAEEIQKFHWSSAVEIPYKVFSVLDYPPVFIPVNKNYEWRDRKYGFIRINNFDWFLWLLAKQIDFESWQKLYYSLQNGFVRQDDWNHFEKLRQEVDADYASFYNEQTLSVESIPF